MKVNNLIRSAQNALSKPGLTHIHNIVVACHITYDYNECVDLNVRACACDAGSYPEISGFFEVGGIFLGNLFLEKYLAKNLGNLQGAGKYFWGGCSLASRSV